MDTNWKKSKLITRILAGWLAMILLFVALFALYQIRPGNLIQNSPDGLVDLSNGEITGMPEYQKVMAEVFYNGLLLACGGADKVGSSASSRQNTELRNAARKKLEQPLGNIQPGFYDDNIYCYIKAENGQAYQNSDYPLVDEGLITPPLGYSVQLAATSGQIWGNKALMNAYEQFVKSQAIQPYPGALNNVTVVFVTRDIPVQNDGPVAAYARDAQNGAVWLLLLLASLCSSLLLAIVCLCMHKRARPARLWAAQLTGKVLPELKLLVLAVWLSFLLHWGFPFRYSFSLYGTYGTLLLLGLPLILSWPLLWLAINDLVYNRQRLISGSACAALWRRLKGFMATARHSLPWQRTYLILLVLGLIATPALALLGIYLAAYVDALPALLLTLSMAAAVFTLYVTIRLIFDMGVITRRLADLRTGQEPGPLTLRPSSLLADAAADVNAVQEGITTMVEARSRADRMKVELVTNVSHDLKTPLTSIISYAQLLQEEPLEGAAADYAKVIARKADRLKAMVQDVFELSKATSGELPLAPACIDLAKLLRQTLADMDEAISQSPLTFKTDLTPEAWVTADGDRMYRVFQNLLGNALQYSLAGSRVHVQLTLNGGSAVATVKNVAAQELDFDLSQITERFVRGDSARSGEGSGLGLSIAKSFTEACGGEFYLRAEADLFCATVTLPLTQTPVEALPPEPEAAPLAEAPAMAQ